MSADDRVVVTTRVALRPDAAFEAFTAGVDRWWKRGPRFRPCVGGDGVLRFEPRVGGRLLEHYDHDGTFFELGRVLVWQPGVRLAFTWRATHFAPGETTEVEVRFEASGEETRVSIAHRGWAALPPDHPARQGHEGTALRNLMGLWWSDQLVAFAARGTGARR